MVKSRTTRPKSPKVGLRQADRLSKLGELERLEFIAKGLPLILRSANGDWDAARQIRVSNRRESAILEGVAIEEAAKILILMDAVRSSTRTGSRTFKSRS